MAAGAGVLLNKPNVRDVLGIISLALLLVLATIFSLGAWRAAKNATNVETLTAAKDLRSRGGYFLGLIFALSSPWNIGFWLAVVGSQQTIAMAPWLIHSVLLACAVVLGAVAWTIVPCVAVRSGARIFARLGWQIWTQALTAAVMVYFAARLVFQFFI